MDQLEKAKNYHTESISLDYLRPYDLEEGPINLRNNQNIVIREENVDDNEQNNTGSRKLRGRPPNKHVIIFTGTKGNINNDLKDKNDNINETKNVVETKVVPKEETNEDNDEEKKRNEKANRALMRFRKTHEKRKKEEDERNKFHQSLKVTNLAKELEDNMIKQKEKEKENETIEHENDNGNRRKRFQRRTQEEY